MKNPRRRPSLLLIDNFDSFTYNLWDYFLRLGASCEVVRNDRINLSALKAGAFDGIVLSPGPRRPENAGFLMDTLSAFHRSTPILGICLGHQAIGSFFGASLVKASKPMHGKISVIEHYGDPVFDGLPASFSVMRYHSLILEDLPPTLVCTARTGSGEIMALRHRELPLTGIQFHPEAVLTEYGLEILRNWIATY